MCIRDRAQSCNDFAAWRPDAVIVNLGSVDALAMTQPPWLGPDGAPFQQSSAPEGLARFEERASAFLRKLRRCNPGVKLVWAYGMAGDQLRPQLERAVERFWRETGEEAWYFPLPLAPSAGPACHKAAAEAAAGFLRTVL